MGGGGGGGVSMGYIEVIIEVTAGMCLTEFIFSSAYFQLFNMYTCYMETFHMSFSKYTVYINTKHDVIHFLCITPTFKGLRRLVESVH